MKQSLDSLLKEAARNTRKRKAFFRELLKHDIHFFVEEENKRFEACGFDLGGEFYIPVYLTRSELLSELGTPRRPHQMNARMFFKKIARGYNVVVHPKGPHEVKFSWDGVMRYLCEA